MKTVLVTGSSRGIGKAIAVKFISEGYKTVMNCKNSAYSLANSISELQKINENVTGYICDIADYDMTKQMFDNIEKKFGKIDILINNTGISYVGLLSEMSPADWDNIIKTNLYSVINTCHLAVPAMISAKSGVIVNISSIWGEEGSSMETVYSATKGGVNSFTKALAKELAPSNIRVNAVACGVIDTEMNDFLTSEEKDYLNERIPMGRFGSVEEVAELVYFLSTEKSNYLTGQIISLNGGFNG